MPLDGSGGIFVIDYLAVLMVIQPASLEVIDRKVAENAKELVLVQ